MNDLKIEDFKNVELGRPFERKWYVAGEKSTRQKLGKLYHANIKRHAKDKERACIARQIHMERISAYTIENFQKKMIQLL